MPTTTKDMALLKEQQQALDAAGVKADLISHQRPMAQWYRADGYVFPNLLPADAYHIRRYASRGMTMTPPVRVSVNADTPGDISVAIADAQPDVPSGVAQHPHRFNKAMGSSCKVAGCTAVRTTPFTKRNRRGK